MVKTRRTLLFLQPDREYLDERKGRSTFYIFLIDWINILSITGRPRKDTELKNRSGALGFFFQFMENDAVFKALSLPFQIRQITRLSQMCSLYYPCDEPIHYPSVLFKILPFELLLIQSLASTLQWSCCLDLSIYLYLRKIIISL